MKKKEKQRFAWQPILVFVVYLLVGVVAGLLIVPMMDRLDSQGDGFLLMMGKTIGLLLVGVYGGMLLHIAVHEAGHLVFGLLTGYGFSSYRVGSIMLLMENGKLKLRKFSLAGTGGQCLMTPPELVDGKMPYVLYNLGGSLMNFGVSLVCLLLSFIAPDYLAVLLRVFAVLGLALGAMNGIPMRLGGVDNDGYNALSLGKSPQALRSFWVQMKANEQIARGVRLKDMPEEWFTVPDEAGMKNSMTAVMGVLACNRMMDAHDFTRAAELMARLWEMDTALTGLHKNLMICDRIYCELIGQNRQEVVDSLLTGEQKKFIKSMKTFPTVLRTEYAYALLGRKDEAGAADWQTKFEKVAKTYPYPSDMESERELMQIAREKANT